MRVLAAIRDWFIEDTSWINFWVQREARREGDLEGWKSRSQ